MTEEEIAEVKGKYRKDYIPDRPLTHMPFGRYKGYALEDVPTFYLAWVLHQETTQRNLLVPVAKILKSRYAEEQSKRNSQLADSAIGD